MLAAEEPLPCAVTEDNDAAGALLIVFRLEAAAEDGLRAEGAEPGPGDRGREQMKRVAVLLGVEALLVIHGG